MQFRVMSAERCLLLRGGPGSKTAADIFSGTNAVILEMLLLLVASPRTEDNIYKFTSAVVSILRSSTELL